MAERIHFYGAKYTMEIIGIFPGGYAVCDGALILGRPRAGHFMPLDKTVNKEDCANAAMALKKAGFGEIMIHAGHNVPFAQFLSPLTNKRTDHVPANDLYDLFAGHRTGVKSHGRQFKPPMLRFDSGYRPDDFFLYTERVLLAQPIADLATTALAVILILPGMRKLYQKAAPHDRGLNRRRSKQ
jgi:hypothetical protein